MKSALLSGLPVDMLKELAAHALQSRALSVDAVVDELVTLSLQLKVVRKIPAPWRDIAVKVERALLEWSIRGIVEEVEDQLIAAGVLPPRPAVAA